MSNLIKPRTLSGFMELSPKDQVLFEEIKRTLEKVYQSYGFFPLDTPVLEHSEILLAKAGGETEKQIYRFSKGDTDLTMRFDLTVPLAKYVALNQNDLVFPFKRYQIGKVYRGERAQKGRFREFYQADIDIIGDGSLNIVNDAEIPSIIVDVMQSLGIEDFTIRINNRKVLNGLFGVFGIANDHAADVLRIIDKVDKIGVDNVKKELTAPAEDGPALVPEESVAEKLLEVLTNKGTDEEILALLGQYRGQNETLDTGIDELQQVLYYLAGFGVSKDKYRLDLTIARGLDYYTGTVYETTVTKHPEIGSVCSGGRYDNLAGYYTSKHLPGVGISIGLTRLFYILNAQNYLNRAKSAPVDVLIIPMTDDYSEAVRVSTQLRNAGLSAQIYFEKKKFKQRIAYADKLGIPYCIFLGDDEIAQHKVALKDMASGQQETLTADEAAARILEHKAGAAAEKCVVM